MLLMEFFRLNEIELNPLRITLVTFSNHTFQTKCCNFDVVDFEYVCYAEIAHVVLNFFIQDTVSSSDLKYICALNILLQKIKPIKFIEVKLWKFSFQFSVYNITSPNLQLGHLRLLHAEALDFRKQSARSYFEDPLQYIETVINFKLFDSGAIEDTSVLKS